MSWLMRSRTSLSKVLFCWLEANLPFPSFWELGGWRAGEDEGTSSRRFFEADEGVAGMLRRALEASPNTRFCGSVVAAIVVLMLLVGSQVMEESLTIELAF